MIAPTHDPNATARTSGRNDGAEMMADSYDVEDNRICLRTGNKLESEGYEVDEPARPVGLERGTRGQPDLMIIA